MPLIANAEYPQIRAALDTTLPVGALSDAIIAYPIYIGAGINDVLDRIPTAEALPADQLQRAKNAAVYFTASRLAVAVPGIVREDLGVEATQFDVAKWADKAETLRAAALAEIEALLAILYPSEAPMPPFFRRAPGRYPPRGW